MKAHIHIVTIARAGLLGLLMPMLPGMVMAQSPTATQGGYPPLDYEPESPSYRAQAASQAPADGNPSATVPTAAAAATTPPRPDSPPVAPYTALGATMPPMMDNLQQAPYSATATASTGPSAPTDVPWGNPYLGAAGGWQPRTDEPTAGNGPDTPYPSAYGKPYGGPAADWSPTGASAYDAAPTAGYAQAPVPGSSESVHAPAR